MSYCSCKKERYTTIKEGKVFCDECGKEIRDVLIYDIGFGL